MVKKTVKKWSKKSIVKKADSAEKNFEKFCPDQFLSRKKHSVLIGEKVTKLLWYCFPFVNVKDICVTGKCVNHPVNTLLVPVNTQRREQATRTSDPNKPPETSTKCG